MIMMAKKSHQLLFEYWREGKASGVTAYSLV